MFPAAVRVTKENKVCEPGAHYGALLVNAYTGQLSVYSIVLTQLLYNDGTLLTNIISVSSVITYDTNQGQDKSITGDIICQQQSL